jgi:hypothetical protein
LDNIAKQQFALWQTRICPQGDGEARQASLNGVDFARLWRTLEAGEGTFLHHLRSPTTEGFTLSIAMATGKLPLLVGLNSARKEHLGNIAKQQFALQQQRTFPQDNDKARRPSLKGVDIARLWRTLEAGEQTFLHHL